IILCSVTPVFRVEAFVGGIRQSQPLKSTYKTPLFEVTILKIAIIGKGNVGSALQSGLSRAGHETRFGHRDPNESVEEAAKWGEVIIIAVPYNNSDDARENIKPYADGKIVIDVMNAIGAYMDLGINCSSSTAEETQRKLPNAHVVKAFNTVFAPNQSTAKLGDTQLTAFFAGDDAGAKQTVAQLTRDMGFDPVDCGPLRNARYLEAMGIMLINLAFKFGMGNKIGYKLIKV
ncbi:MAG TPA: NADPH-dependent F420 reductase, partial [Candidatus Acidoferrales bacterium]|nr:NADPH-dependent F420 reductase [Candidatus Acidoferrales bacterium]